MHKHCICEVCGAPFACRGGACRFCSRKCTYAGRQNPGTPEWLFAKADCSGGPDACWIWQGGSVQGRGYGVTWCKGKSWRTHRLAYTITHGPIPEGQFVCHRCDNPACINPKHLFLGTAHDNALDRERKGRGHRENAGSKNHWARLTEDDVVAIKRRIADWEGPRWKIVCLLALEHDVCPKNIESIMRGKSWRHVA